MIWTEYYPENNTLVDAERMSVELQQDLDKINGGLGAENLPASCITPATLNTSDPIFVHYDTCDVEIPVIYDPGAYRIAGGVDMSQNGSVYHRATNTLTFSSAGGMLEVKACLLFWVCKVDEGIALDYSWIKANIVLDGVVIASTGKPRELAGNLIPFACVPIVPGNHTLSVEVIISHHTPQTIPSGSPLTATSTIGYWQGTLSYVNRQR